MGCIIILLLGQLIYFFWFTFIFVPKFQKARYW